MDQEIQSRASHKTQWNIIYLYKYCTPHWRRCNAMSFTCTSTVLHIRCNAISFTCTSTVLHIGAPDAMQYIYLYKYCTPHWRTDAMAIYLLVHQAHQMQCNIIYLYKYCTPHWHTRCNAISFTCTSTVLCNAIHLLVQVPHWRTRCNAMSFTCTSTAHWHTRCNAMSFTHTVLHIGTPDAMQYHLLVQVLYSTLAHQMQCNIIYLYKYCTPHWRTRCNAIHLLVQVLYSTLAHQMQCNIYIYLYKYCTPHWRTRCNAISFTCTSTVLHIGTPDAMQYIYLYKYCTSLHIGTPDCLCRAELAQLQQ